MIEPVPLQDIPRVEFEPERPGAEGAGTAHHLPRHGPVARRAAVLQRQGQEPIQGHARPPGLLQGDRHRADQDARDARAVDAVGAHGRPAFYVLSEGVHAAEIRSRRRQEAPDRGRLSRRLRGHHGLPERSLRQRRGDLPGGRRHARPHRRQGESAGAAQGAVLRQGAGPAATDLVLPAGLDAGHVRLPQHALQHHGLPRRSASPPAAGQSRRLLQHEGRRHGRQGRWSRPTRPSATSDQGGLRTSTAEGLSATSRCTSRRSPGASPRRSTWCSAPTTWSCSTGRPSRNSDGCTT